MSKKILLMCVLGMFAVVSLQSSLYAADTEEMGEMRTGYGEKGGMGRRDKGMHMMMKMMMDKSVVATSDGGVVVVAGKKMTKYDSALNVVKEVEIKMDMDAMMQDMKEMKEKCTMMGKPETTDNTAAQQ